MPQEEYVEAQARQNDRGQYTLSAKVHRGDRKAAIDDLVTVIKDMEERFKAEGLPVVPKPLDIT